MGGEKSEFSHANAFYGVPAIDGPEGGLKVATETYDATVDPDGSSRAAGADATGEFYDQYLSRHFPWVGPRALSTIPCLYTITREGRFIIDRHPDHANVMIVSACSGHGFKHSPAIGEAVAQLIVDGASDADLSPFRMA
jgi:sarcosine oxidase